MKAGSVGKDVVPGPLLGFMMTCQVTEGWAAMVVVTGSQAPGEG